MTDTLTLQNIEISFWGILYIVAYLLKARIVMAKKELLLDNDQYT
jgi:hypothetical protein